MSHFAVDVAKFGALFPYIFGMILGYSTFFNEAQEVAVARESLVNFTGYRLEIASDASYVLRNPLTPTPPRCIRLWEWVILSMVCYFTNRTLLV